MAVVRGKILGSLLGLAVCDAVGTTVEFMPPGSFTPVSGMQGGGKFSLEPGEVSLHSLRWYILSELVMTTGLSYHNIGPVTSPPTWRGCRTMTA